MHDDILCTGRSFGAGMSGPGGVGIMFTPLPVRPAILIRSLELN
jgi:hypothetical protein